MKLYCAARFVQGEVEIVPGRYANGRLALRLVDPKTGEQWCVATVNIPEVNLEDDEIIIKDWSENEGIFDWLVREGLIEDTRKFVRTDLVVAPIGRATDKLKELIGSDN